MKKLNKKQQEAIDSLVVMIDELDNKPRRLFSALREVAEAFITGDDYETKQYRKKVIGSINQFEEWYYLNLNLPEITREVMQATTDTKRELLEQDSYFDNDQDAVSHYIEGVDDCKNLIAEKIITGLIKWHNH